MAGRPLRDEGIGGDLADHLVDRARRAADGTERRLERAGRHRGVGIKLDQALLRHGILDFDDVVHRMAERCGFERAKRRLLANERLELLLLQYAFNRANAIGPLGMSRAIEMIE